MYAKRQIILIALLSTICVAASAATGTAPDANSPESVVRQFLETMKTAGAAQAASEFTHPDECARLKVLVMPRIRRSFETAGDDFPKKTLGEALPLSAIEKLAPCSFLKKFLWQSQMDGTAVKSTKFTGRVREGDVVRLTVLTDLVDLEGKPARREDVLALKAFGQTWRMMLSPELEAYVQILIKS